MSVTYCDPDQHQWGLLLPGDPDYREGWVTRRCFVCECHSGVAASAPSRSDPGAPSSAPVGSGATEDAKGPQISDPVNSPKHYRQYPVEVIEITEMLSFTLGNVVKYVLRADYKGKPIEDLEKAAWYLAREIANRKRLAELDTNN